MVTMHCVVGSGENASPDITTSGTTSLRWPPVPSSTPLKRGGFFSLAMTAAQQMSSSPTGLLVVMPHWMSQLSTHYSEAAVTPGHSLSFAFERKMRGAADDCERQGASFIPLAFESLGGWHSAAVREVKKIA